MTLVDVRLTGAGRKNAQVVVKLKAPVETRTAYHLELGEVLETVAKVTTDSNGYVQLDLPSNDSLDPENTFYEVTVPREHLTRYIYLTETNAPSVNEPYDLGNPLLQVTTTLPPEYVPRTIPVSAELVAPIVTDVISDNPEVVEAGVEAYLQQDPPLRASQNGADVTDDATFRSNIGAAAATLAAEVELHEERLDAIDQHENVNPAVRQDDGPLVHTQVAPSATWVIEHPYKGRPVVTIVNSADEEVEGDITYGTGELTITFSGGFSGTAEVFGIPA